MQIPLQLSNGSKEWRWQLSGRNRNEQPIQSRRKLGYVIRTQPKISTLYNTIRSCEFECETLFQCNLVKQLSNAIQVKQRSELG
jgi:hypothetical protein